MFRLDEALKVYLHREPIDFRLNINGLALLVEQALGDSIGRGGGIRTRDPLHPINVKRRISRSHRAPPNLNTTLFTNNYLV